jgi:Putative prokaryotic signal transducing protein
LSVRRNNWKYSNVLSKNLNLIQQNRRNMSTNNEDHSVEIYAGDMIGAGMVKSLLENAEIKAYLKDEIIGTLTSWIAAPGGAGAIKVLISSADYDRAKRIVDQYYDSLKEE